MAIRWSQTAISFRLNWVKLGQSVFEKKKKHQNIRNAMLNRAQSWT